MVATFVVEDGTSVTGANSYMTEADADQYHDDYGSATAWDAVADKELNLRKATQYLDAVYVLRWKGDRSTDTQGLDWPRAHVWTNDGFAVASNIVPQELKDACAALALLAETETLLPDIAVSAAGIKRQKNKVGPLEQDTEYISSKPRYKRYSLVEGFLRDLLLPKGHLVRG